MSIWKVAGKPVTIDEFIEEGSDRVDATGFRGALRSLNGRLWEKLESINAEEYPDLREAVQLIIQVLQSPEAWQAKDPLPRWLAEVAFGARYLLKRFDLIEDALDLCRSEQRPQASYYQARPHGMLKMKGNSRAGA